MARPDGRIEKGQRLSTAISARAWNRTQEAADRVLGPQASFEAGAIGSTQAPYQWVYAKNTTGSDLARWGVLAITGLEITPTGDNVAQFEAMPVLTGATPSASTTAWGIAVEPIAASKIGRLAVAGVVQCRVSVSSSAHKFVRAKASATELESANIGEGLLLYTIFGWGLVRLGTIDLTKYQSYDATRQQILGHAANGGLQWLNTTGCA